MIPQVMPQLNGVMREQHVIETIPSNGRVHWAYGITCVPSRFDTLLPKTIANLKRGGFTAPTLYADRCSLKQALELEQSTGLRVVPRHNYSNDLEGVAWANYLLALWDLLIRHRNATRFVIFQDDVTVVTNLLQYLSTIELKEDTYWNLYTGNMNELICNHMGISGQKGVWFKSDQRGRGALALVLGRNAVEDLLSHPVTVQRPRSASKNWHKNLDGWVCEVLINQLKKYTELCHSPSLVQHIGFMETTLMHQQYVPTKLYPGDEWDALSLLEKK
jgi:hypothetical protein